MNRREHGDAMVLILALSLIASLLAVASPWLQAQIITDQRRMIETHMAADAGITAAIHWLDTAGSGYWDDRPKREDHAIAAIHARHDNHFGDRAYWRIVGLDFHHPRSDTVTIRSRGGFVDDPTRRDITVHYQRPATVSLSSARSVHGWQIIDD